ALYLIGDLLIQNLHPLNVRFIVAAQLPSLGDEPVRKSAVAHFAVIPRAEAQNEWEPDIFARCNEISQAPPAGPVPFAFDLLVMNPENIGGDDVDPARLHLQQLIAPFGFGIT